MSTQQIFRIRRDYNAWVANETLEDYALRYTPRSFRRWSEWRVANTALGATSFLALEAIGGAMALNYGFTNALWAILAVGLVTFLTGLPICYHAARYGVDMDLLTRGAGFGYLGSTLSSLVYAGFTFIFLALEGAILSTALQLYSGWPQWLCHVLAALVIVPLVMHGITLISRLQMWTQPLWLLLLAAPYLAVAAKDPGAFHAFAALRGQASGSSDFELPMFGAATVVAFSLVVQVGEQVDYLRFMPERTPANRVRWWAAVLAAGPGWIVPGMLKMLGGAFLAFLVLRQGGTPQEAVEPVHMYLAAYSHLLDDPGWVLALTALFVVVSQVKINLTNAYAGSLAWSNVFARLTHSHPGRVVWLVFNVLIALLLMMMDVFGALERVLGYYGTVAVAWVGALVADLVINKPLGWSPRHIEFKRAHLYELNPVGLGAMGLAALLGVLTCAGAFGQALRPYSAFIALFTAMAVSPLLAWRTRGRYYLARQATHWPPGQLMRCAVCEKSFESEDMAHCPAYGAPICSLCCTLESRCDDRCKTRSRAGEQIQDALQRLLPAAVSSRLNFRVGHYLVVVCSLLGLVALALWTVYEQQGVRDAAVQSALRAPMLQAFALLSLGAAVGAWWVVLSSESRRLAQSESSRQYRLLLREVEAHRRTDAALQSAKDAAEAANQAKTRYVAGITHELRTPLNTILGYTQILLKDARLLGTQRSSVLTIHRSGEHLRGLIEGLLDLARIEAGRVRLDRSPLPVEEFLDDLARMVEPQAQAKGLRFELRTLGHVPAYVNADARRLRQILLNLLGNAVRFTERGSVTLEADFRREVARFEVSDTGIGIAVEDHERIFMPFERGSAGRRSGEPGTGLGLTITRLLTQLMGGELILHSEPGQGSRFTLRLYLSTIEAPPRPPRLHRPVSGYLGTRRTLLVVDDQPTQRQMLAGMLMPLGFQLREAASGRECLESVAEQCPDAVLLDLTMDDMDGWETARRLRAAGYERLPIIVVSANAFENRPELLQEAGCQAFVDKPVIESELLDVLQRTLDVEWLAELPEPDWGAHKPPPGPLRLPRERLGGLMRLAALGHVQGLREALAQTTAAHPEAADALQRLLALLDRLDLPGLREELAEALRSAPQEVE